ncbi:MAG: hypothetical protein JXM69_18610 [Anaerolineae bacterium]|nr:hypothetical protein [Anaerolineae bacterium]
MTKRSTRKSNNPSPRFRFSLFYLSTVIVIALGLRVIKLNQLPLSLSLDEATNGLDALQLLRQTWLTPFLQNNFGRETLFFYLQAVALQFYGISIFSLRFASVLVATLTIPLMYVTGQRFKLDTLFVSSNRKSFLPATNLLAATGLAVSYWHIFFSRLGLRAILLPPLVLVLVWCFWRGWDDESKEVENQTGDRGFPLHQKQRYWLIVAGFFLGLTFYTYLAARLLPLLFFTFFIVELVRHKTNRCRKLVDFLIFNLTVALVIVPLALYFYQHPQALSSRTQALSILAAGNPLPALAHNLTSLLAIHFGGGAWLGQWPSLDGLFALGLFIGLAVCIYHFKKPACLFLLLWWFIGTAPVVISQQDWTGTTTLLRGILAWPAMFLLAAIGLTFSVRLILQQLNKLHRAISPHLVEILFLCFILIFGSVTSIYNYFSVWAATYNKFSDHPPYLARYLNHQTDQLTLVPLKFYGESVGNFLLQAHYPSLTNLDLKKLHALLESNQPAVYLLPADSPNESVFVLLAPALNGQGTAYLLPPLTLAQVETLTSQSKSAPPLATIRDSEQEPIAHVYPLPADAAFLPSPTPADTPPTPIQASFNGDILLLDYQVEPAVLKPGETVTLSLDWQALRPIDGDYYLFVHLFDLPTGQRHGQINAPLTGMLFDAHRWPAGLTVPDRHYFTLPMDAPEGVYRFEAGLYHAASLERLPVTPTSTQPPKPDDKVILGKFHVGQQPPLPPSIPLTNVQFGDCIALLGLDVGTGLSDAPLQRGQNLNYKLYWQALAPIAKDYVVFTHLLDTESNIQAQQDNPPQQGRYPTSWWDTGEIVIDSYNLSLPPNLAPGWYTLRLGLYEAEIGQRLPLKNQPQDFVDLPNLITVE